ncbi:hypothetical protein EDD11_000722 [Mortierella claussenii]|nr:hypothetical protein EDD11_000722 [Mortierella claussenii]
MPFVQPRGVPLNHSGNNSTVSPLSEIPSSIGINGRSPQQEESKKFDPERACQVKNNWVKSADDSIHIFTKSWQPVDTPVQSVVVFIHDVVEHCERYQPLFIHFAGKGIEVQSFDLPGFGETGARADALGITGGYDVLLKEIDSAIGRASSCHPTKPLFLMGHGMGGALVLNYICGLGKWITSLAGVISSSPYLKPSLVGSAARFPSTYNKLGKWYPGINVSFEVSPQELTRDHAEQERYRGDGLIRDSLSLQCCDMIYQGNKVLNKRWKKFPVPLPTLLLHGTDDPVCAHRATATLYNKLQRLNPLNLKFVAWKGSRHDPHWDIEAAAVRGEYIHWIRNNTKYFDRMLLEPGIVHNDSMKAARSTKSSNRIRFARVFKKDKAVAIKPDVAKDQEQGAIKKSEKGINSKEKEAKAKEEKKRSKMTEMELQKAEKQKVQKGKEQEETNGSVEMEKDPATVAAVVPSTSVESSESTVDQHKEQLGAIQRLKGLMRRHQIQSDKTSEHRKQQPERELDERVMFEQPKTEPMDVNYTANIDSSHSKNHTQSCGVKDIVPDLPQINITEDMNLDDTINTPATPITALAEIVSTAPVTFGDHAPQTELSGTTETAGDGLPMVDEAIERDDSNTGPRSQIVDQQDVKDGKAVKLDDVDAHLGVDAEVVARTAPVS